MVDAVLVRSEIESTVFAFENHPREVEGGAATEDDETGALTIALCALKWIITQNI
jgi:hypothetical protein